jgi:hypothetical protein
MKSVHDKRVISTEKRMEDHAVIFEIATVTVAIPVRGPHVDLNISAKPLPGNL